MCAEAIGIDFRPGLYVPHRSRVVTWHYREGGFSMVITYTVCTSTYDITVNNCTIFHHRSRCRRAFDNQANRATQKTLSAWRRVHTCAKLSVSSSQKHRHPILKTHHVHHVSTRPHSHRHMSRGRKCRARRAEGYMHQGSSVGRDGQEANTAELLSYLMPSPRCSPTTT